MPRGLNVNRRGRTNRSEARERLSYPPPELRDEAVEQGHSGLRSRLMPETAQEQPARLSFDLT